MARIYVYEWIWATARFGMSEKKVGHGHGFHLANVARDGMSGGVPVGFTYLVGGGRELNE
jgi:hypothetical protein